MLHKQYEDNQYSKKKSGHGITRVSNLFSKYAKLLKAPQGTVVQACIDVIFDIYGITLKKNQCTYQVQSKTLVLHIPGTIKSEVLLNKEVILSEMAKKIGVESTPKNIL